MRRGYNISLLTSINPVVVLSVLCAIFPGILDESTGRTIVDGKKVTGFTTQGEEEEGVLDIIINWIKPAIEKAAKNAGATCEYCD
jgi:hypothetical protein